MQKAKNELLAPGSDCEAWEDLGDRYELSADERDIRIAQELFLAGIEVSRNERVLDFDDLLYHAAIGDFPLPQFGFVGIDEAQDLNRAQHEILRRTLKPEGRLLAVGDEHQSIYAFRGAMADSFDAVKVAFKCRVLPLNICYRCSQAVVQYAQRFVPELETYKQAPKGEVREGVSVDWHALILGVDGSRSKNNTPLLKLALSRVCGGIGSELPAATSPKLSKTLWAASTPHRYQSLGKDRTQWHDRKMDRREGRPPRPRASMTATAVSSR